VLERGLLSREQLESILQPEMLTRPRALVPLRDEAKQVVGLATPLPALPMQNSRS
jgi:hypothetical protein